MQEALLEFEGTLLWVGTFQDTSHHTQILKEQGGFLSACQGARAFAFAPHGDVL